MAAHIETGTMASPDHYSSKLLNHLGLVAFISDELGIGKLIDKLIPQDNEKRVVSIGQSSSESHGIEWFRFCQSCVVFKPSFVINQWNV